VTLLAIEGLRRSYEATEVLRDIDLSIGRSEVLHAPSIPNPSESTAAS
jgi:ABC-type polar amino acid transport system ATPase subunit